MIRPVWIAFHGNSVDRVFHSSADDAIAFTEEYLQDEFEVAELERREPGRLTCMSVVAFFRDEEGEVIGRVEQHETYDRRGFYDSGDCAECGACGDEHDIDRATGMCWTCVYASPLVED